MNLIDVSELDVFFTLSKLDISKATGSDGFGPKLLKFCAPAISTPIQHLFSLSLSQHCIPADWCIHSITPLFKSGDKSSVKNYRPISILPTISLVFERIVFNKTINFVSKSISPSQFGFLKNHSTLQQLLIFLDSIYKSFDNKKSHVDTIYLDFKKAFDSVPHNELLYKLWSFGITGDLWHWFKAYLTSRFQMVTLNSQKSKLLPVLSGVPQGSILGPMLFLIYINDLPSYIASSSLLLFADDAKCFKLINSPSDASLLQEDISSLYKWTSDWNLKFNTLKCYQMSFSTTEPVIHPAYTINNVAVSTKSCQRDLGIIMSSDLSWNLHIDSIIAKAYKILGLLRRTFSNANSPDAKKSLYISLVRSQLAYCSQIWRPHLKKFIEALETVQRRATKYILNDYISDYKTRLSNLNMLPLMMVFEINDILFTVKSFKHSPEHTHFNLNNFITLSSNSTRSSSHSKLTHSQSSSSKCHHFYFNRLPRLWNSLPSIDITLSLPLIKTQLNNYFYHHFINNFNPEKSCSFHYLCPCTNCSHLTPSPRFNSFPIQAV